MSDPFVVIMNNKISLNQRIRTNEGQEFRSRLVDAVLKQRNTTSVCTKYGNQSQLRRKGDQDD